MSLQTFPRFLELPKELQIQIWRQAIEEADYKADVANIVDYTAPPGGKKDVLLEAPYSHRRIYQWNWKRQCDQFPHFFRIMSSCRMFRLLSLEFWHQEVRTSPVGRFRAPDKYSESVRREVLDVLEECIEQVRHAMLVDDFRARAGRA